MKEETMTFKILNLHYPNEKMNVDDHFIFQMTEFVQHHYHRIGLSPSIYDYELDEVLLYRIDQTIREQAVKVIFFEMKEKTQTDWKTMYWLKKKYNIPIIIFSEVLDNDDVYLIANMKIENIITTYSNSLFEEALKRNVCF